MTSGTIDYTRLLGFESVTDQWWRASTSATRPRREARRQGRHVEPLAPAIDYAQLLGFELVSDRVVEGVDFRDETVGAKLGAKVGSSSLLPRRRTLLAPNDRDDNGLHTPGRRFRRLGVVCVDARAACGRRQRRSRARGVTHGAAPDHGISMTESPALDARTRPRADRGHRQDVARAAGEVDGLCWRSRRRARQHPA